MVHCGINFPLRSNSKNPMKATTRPMFLRSHSCQRQGSWASRMIRNPFSKFGFFALALVTPLPSYGQIRASDFEPPFRLKADGRVIDTGRNWGHSSPCVMDLDGDGLQDLLVGSFNGKFRQYKNVGTAKAPIYEDVGDLKAGGVDAQVRIYCCIGGQPRFCDLDGDGFTDMIANSYDPGHCHWFRGLPDHKFDAPKELQDKNGIPVRSSPVQKQNFESFGSFYETVDWDNDGDLDLFIGSFEGGLKLRINEGSAKDPVFAADNIEIKAGGKPLKVSSHMCPLVADWDGDGLWDLLAGSDDGSVTFFRNDGSKNAPTFEAGQVLVPQHEGNGYHKIFFDEGNVVPGIRSQIDVVDYNGDGKQDLLLGDFYTSYALRSDLSDTQKQAVEAIMARSNEMKTLSDAYSAKREAMEEDFKRRFPGEESMSDAAQVAWQQEYGQLKESSEYKALRKASDKAAGERIKMLQPYLDEMGRKENQEARSHGHVWVFLRK
jgi:hypothetical protein